jgi:hypothetical protein
LLIVHKQAFSFQASPCQPPFSFESFPHSGKAVAKGITPSTPPPCDAVTVCIAHADKVENTTTLPAATPKVGKIVEDQVLSA